MYDIYGGYVIRLKTCKHIIMYIYIYTHIKCVFVILLSTRVDGSYVANVFIYIYTYIFIYIYVYIYMYMHIYTESILVIGMNAYTIL